MSINEKKLSADKQCYLGLGRLNFIHTGYTLYNLLFWEDLFIVNNTKPEEIPSSLIHVD